MTKLQISGIQKAFDNQSLLSGIYLECIKGEIVAILGRNGTGKSTMFKIILGLIKEPSSLVRIDNANLVGREITKRISYLPQHSFLPKNLKLSQLKAHYYNQEVAEPLQSFFLDHQKMRVSQLSGGMARYLETLMVLHLPSDFVILDEPFSFLSPLLRAEVQKVIIGYKGKKGVLLSDHAYELAVETADRVVLLKDGNLQNIQNLEELRELEYLN